MRDTARKRNAGKALILRHMVPLTIRSLPKTDFFRTLRILLTTLPNWSEWFVAERRRWGLSECDLRNFCCSSEETSIEEQLSPSVSLDEKRQFQEEYDVSEHVERDFSRLKKRKHR